MVARTLARRAVEMTTVIVSGALANRPLNGGGAWVRLSWIRGLQRLGFDVVFLEQITPAACLTPEGHPASLAESVAGRYFSATMRQFELDDRSALLAVESDETLGMTRAEVLERAAEAALLVNLGGHLTLEPFLRAPARTAFVDLDPGFTQLWHTDGTLPVPEHDLYFTIAENIGRPGCSLPTGGLRWLTTRHPLVLADWPLGAGGEAYTTVGSWRGPFGRVVHDGLSMGAKAHEFRKLIPLPERTGCRFELALEIHPGDARDRRELEHHGWRLVDPRRVVADPAAFRSYVARSRAEFSAAQEVYVATSSGWFSDRTVRYLASGRPAVVQDTGLSAAGYPVGEGLLAFRTLEEAAQAVARVEADLDGHARAARRLAEDMFDSDRVLRRFAELAEVAP